MKIITRLFFALLITSSSVSAYGQNKFHVHLDYNYLLGVSETGDLWTIKSGLNGFDLNITGMYDINKRLSAGVGFGLEKLYNPQYTIYPVFAKVTYAPIRTTQKPYIFAKLGYGIETNVSNAGLLLNTGLGYKLMLRKRFGLNFMVGYHLQSIQYDQIMYTAEGDIIGKKGSTNDRHSVSFGIGFIF